MWGEEASNPALHGLPEPGSRWEIIEKIGSGSFGEVHKARDFTSGRIVAIKIMVCESEKDEELRMELEILQNHCCHENLPAFYGAFVQHSDLGSEMDRLWLVMELCQGGSMSDIVKGLEKGGHRLSEKTIAYTMKETLKGLQFLQSRDIVHRDVKGGNILVTHDAHIKLVDFGVCAQLKSKDQKRNTSIGTPYWMAPEVIACEHYLEADYDSRCDVWSFAITIIELCDAHPPWHETPVNQAIFKIPRSEPPTVKSPTSWSNQLNDMVKKCLVKNYEVRPTLADLFEMDFILSVQDNTKPVRRELMAAVDLSRGTAGGGTVSDSESDSGADEIDGHADGDGMTLRSGRKVGDTVVHDLATLEQLDEANLLFHLRNRYGNDMIYTNIGDILLAINPFQTLDIYNEATCQRYSSTTDVNTLPPHVYTIAWHCYTDMMANSRNQCCVISGESGSGKTETAKLLVQQFTKLGKAINASLESSILKVNPLFEAFGNASTVMNANSSRFGKYLTLSFMPTGHIVAAQMSQYLLESSRVVFQAPGERNFHIFYYLYAGLGERSLLSRYHLVNINQHRYLRSSQSEVRQSADNSRAAFKEILKCFDAMGFSEVEVDNIIHVLVAILHIGDIQIGVDSLASASHGIEATTITNPDKAPVIGFLLGLKSDDILQAITTNVVTLKGETIVCPNTMEQAGDCRDAMAKALYGRLFSWLVNRCNLTLQAKRSDDQEMLEAGILDIFGFEDFKSNGFEQLFINITNEQMQHFFNQHIFALEQGEYGREGISVSAVPFIDNTPCLEMFLQKPLGMLALLDEESRFPRATEQTLIEKLHTHLRDNAYYQAPRDNSSRFTIVHYAGKVTYEVVAFLEKNRNTVPVKMTELLFQSRNGLVQQLFDSKLTKTGNLPTRVSASKLFPRRLSSRNVVAAGRTPSASHQGVKLPGRGTGGATTSRRMQTASWHFNNSLNELLVRMRNAQPHFIRCIKPNNVQEKANFVTDKVQHQLKYTGVLESIRIRQKGYSHRILYADFWIRYKIIAFPLTHSAPANRSSCEVIAKRAGLSDFALGKTKIFLRYFHVDLLNRKRMEFDSHARLMQKWVRGWLARCAYGRVQKQRQEAATKIQSAVRGWLLHRFYRRRKQKLIKVVVEIQACIRGQLMRRHLVVMKAQVKAANLIQRAANAWLTRRRYLELLYKRERSALLLQDRIRHWLAWCDLKRKAAARQQVEMRRLNRAATTLQSAVRRFLAVRLRRRLQQKREQDLEDLRKHKLRQQTAATAISKTVRGWLAGLRYKRILDARNQAARMIQKAYRQRMRRDHCRRVLKAKVAGRRAEREELELKRTAVLAGVLSRSLPRRATPIKGASSPVAGTPVDVGNGLKAGQSTEGSTIQTSKSIDQIDGQALATGRDGGSGMVNPVVSKVIGAKSSTGSGKDGGAEDGDLVQLAQSSLTSAGSVKSTSVQLDSYTPITPDSSTAIPAQTSRSSFKWKPGRSGQRGQAALIAAAQKSGPVRSASKPAVAAKSRKRPLAGSGKLPVASEGKPPGRGKTEQFFEPPLPSDDNVDITDRDVYGMTTPSSLTGAKKTAAAAGASIIPSSMQPAGVDAFTHVARPSQAVARGQLTFLGQPTAHSKPRTAGMQMRGAGQSAKVSQLAARFSQALKEPVASDPVKTSRPGRLAKPAAFQFDTAPADTSFVPLATRVRAKNKSDKKRTGFLEFSIID